MRKNRSLALLLIALCVSPMLFAPRVSAQSGAATAPSSAVRETAPVQVVPNPGPGVISLDGPWQFHTGDDPSFAAPSLDDSTGHDGWEQIAVDAPWGAQGHRSYTGFAWYRKHLKIAPGSGAPDQLALLVSRVQSTYEIYWNGTRIGGYGKMPPYPSWSYDDSALRFVSPQSFDIDAAGDGVLAVRVWFRPLLSFDDGLQGGFYTPPRISTPAIASQSIAVTRYDHLRASFYQYILQTLYGLVLVLSLVGWLRNRSQRTLLWMAVFCCGEVGVAVNGIWSNVISFQAGYCYAQTFTAVRDVGLWFLILALLDLQENHRLVRFTRIFTWVAFVDGFLDGLVALPDLGNHSVAVKMQVADAVFTLPYILMELYPLVLVCFAIRKRLDATRWAVALFVLASEMLFACTSVLQQGRRFTHWTIADTIDAPLFSLGGSQLNAASLASAGLFLAIVYAVFRYMREATQRQQAIEQELENARAVQQVLVPEAIPDITGFTIDSVYRPFSQVGGDFFQILPLADGGVLTVIGDVSGKGMPAAMTVSLLIGTLRTLAHYTQSPGEILAVMNQRMLGRNNGGFTTCLVLTITSAGIVTAANAGHIPPYLNGHELQLDSGLPIGLAAGVAYPEATFTLPRSARLTLITDGVLEATNPTTKELFGFERTAALSTQTAEEIARTAQEFGQDDDITVLTLAVAPVAAVIG